jgi:predicted ATPase
MIAFYEPQQHHRALVSLRGSDSGTSALASDALCLWCLGYPERAAKRSQEALALARKLGHPFSLAEVLCYAGGFLSELRRDAHALMAYGEELEKLAKTVPAWSGTGVCFHGEALILLGQVQEGLAQLRQGMATYEALGLWYHLPGRLLFQAEAQAATDQPEAGLATLDKALTLAEDTGERYWEAELYRVRAELQLVHGNQREAEASLQHAIQVARRQQARSWELRATTSLCRLWQKQGKQEEARSILSKIYGWFTEGFDTPDLQEAKTLLDELS